LVASFPGVWKMGEERLVSTVCACTAPQACLGNLEMAIILVHVAHYWIATSRCSIFTLWMRPPTSSCPTLLMWNLSTNDVARNDIGSSQCKYVPAALTRIHSIYVYIPIVHICYLRCNCCTRGTKCWGWQAVFVNFSWLWLPCNSCAGFQQQ